MRTFLLKTEPFERHPQEYDEWFDKHPFVFQSEVEALREKLPEGDLHGIEIGLGTGRFAVALGLKEGVEPVFSMRRIAHRRGIETMDAVAEKLPYKDLHFDFVVMASSVSYFYNMHVAFREASRVVKHGGCIIIGFIEKESIIGKYYEDRRQTNDFYKEATFYSIPKIIAELKNVGFIHLEFSQTLFHNINDITEFEPAKPGYGDGSYVVIKAIKK